MKALWGCANRSMVKCGTWIDHWRRTPACNCLSLKMRRVRAFADSVCVCVCVCVCVHVCVCVYVCVHVCVCVVCVYVCAHLFLLRLFASPFPSFHISHSPPPSLLFPLPLTSPLFLLPSFLLSIKQLSRFSGTRVHTF